MRKDKNFEFLKKWLIDVEKKIQYLADDISDEYSHRHRIQRLEDEVKKLKQAINGFGYYY